MDWKIYYGDGTTFSNLDGDPENAPALNVIAVVCDPFCWREGDIFGLFDYLIQPGLKVVKFGRTIETATFQEIMKIARNDPHFDLRKRYVNEGGDFYWFVGDE